MTRKEKRAAFNKYHVNAAFNMAGLSIGLDVTHDIFIKIKKFRSAYTFGDILKLKKLRK